MNSDQPQNGARGPSTLSLDDGPDLNQITQALEAVYSLSSSNATRGEATAFLEKAKHTESAPVRGFALAIDISHNQVLRHYGLSMLEHYIKYVWHGEEAASEMLRGFITQLAEVLTAEDPAYFRNKVAQLWAEIAKRAWGVMWMDMDQLLHLLWNSSLLGKSFVLFVLETLSDELFTKEEGGTRANELSQACIEIFTSTTARQEDTQQLRYGKEGWLSQICTFLKAYFSDEIVRNSGSNAVALKALHTLRSTLNWISPRAVIDANATLYFCAALDASEVQLKDAGADCLNAVCSRMHLHDDDLNDMIRPLLRSRMIGTYDNAMKWAVLDPNDIDFDVNTFLKKHAEFLSHLGGWLELKPRRALDVEGLDIKGILALFWALTAHQSLYVSIPLMHLWPRLLKSHNDFFQRENLMQPYIPQLLQLCTSRLIRYEQLPDGVTEPTFLFLAEDFDTLPERHAFLGNYRRLCVDVIEVIVRQHPAEAIGHILAQSTESLQQLAGQAAQTPKQFSRASTTLVMIESQIQAVDAAIKGYLKWVCAQGVDDPQKNESDRARILIDFQHWCEVVFQLDLKDPEILRRLVPVAVSISTKVLKSLPGFATVVVEKLLSITLKEDATHSQYSDSVKTLQHVFTIELQRMAMVFSDQFLEIYNVLETRIRENIEKHTLEMRPQLGYRAFLIIIIQRASNLDHEARLNRMQQMLMPVRDGWQDTNLASAVTSFESFCELMGFGTLMDYLSSRNFQNVEDWSEKTLDAEGQALQVDITNRSDLIPIRLTKAMLAATTEKAEPGSAAMEVAQVLWSSLMPSIVPNLLQMISHAQSFYNMERWRALPVEMQHVVQRILTDRFWQVGISTESKDDFFAKVNNSRTSYEGLASTVRGTMRQVRETAYYILYGFSKFKEFFYGLEDLPQPLSQALFANAPYLSPHHFSVLLTVSSQLIDGCPRKLRENFLPPMLSMLFRQTDIKLNAEWDKINRRLEQVTDDDNLGEEMRTESILRQLTYSAVQIANSVLDKHRYDSPELSTEDDGSGLRTSHMHQFAISHENVLEPLLIFSKSALRFRDIRSVSTIIRVLKDNVLPAFQAPGFVHDFLCRDILQAAIQSLHEPYFIDAQRDLATLIAQLIKLDQRSTRNVILQLPGLAAQQGRVDSALQHIESSSSDRNARAWVLELLKDVRGVGIHEIGRMERPSMRKKPRDEYMNTDDASQQTQRGGSPALDGVASMFQA